MNIPNTRPQNSRQRFTLTEMCVVVGMLGVVAVLAVPVVPRLEQKTDQAICYTNLKELGMAWEAFADDHDQWLLPATTTRATEPEWPQGFPDTMKQKDTWWSWLIADGYVSSELARGAFGLFRCPADGTPVKGESNGETILLSYAYMDYFGRAYATNKKGWPSSRMYGLKRRTHITKHPGETPVMMDVSDSKYKAGNLVVPSGGYTNLPHSRWAGFRHEGRVNVLFDAGHVDALKLDSPVLTWDCRDLF